MNNRENDIQQQPKEEHVGDRYLRLGKEHKENIRRLAKEAAEIREKYKSLPPKKPLL